MKLKPRPFRKPNLAHPLAKGLIGCWLMNEGGGNITADLSGNNHTGSLVATAHFVGGESGPAIDFDGNSDFVTAANIPNNWLTPPCTIVCRFKVDVLPSTTGDEYTLFRYAQVTHDTLRYQIRIEDNGADADKLIAGVTQGPSFTSSQTITVGKWHQAVLVSYSSTSHQVFLDAIAGETDTTAFPDIGTEEFRIGVNFFTTDRDYMLGQISHVYVYNRALSISEIEQLFKEPFAMFDYEPIELWVGSVGAGAPPGANPKGPLGHPLYGALAGPISF